MGVRRDFRLQQERLTAWGLHASCNISGCGLSGNEHGELPSHSTKRSLGGLQPAWRRKTARRMYHVQRGEILIVMLGGGDKSTQQADIRQAIALAKPLED